MPKYHVKISRSVIIWEEALTIVEADNRRDAEDIVDDICGCDLDWIEVDSEGQDYETEILEEIEE